MATRRPRPAAPPAQTPFDVRLMNGASALLFTLALLAFGALVLGWALRAPMFSLQGVRIDGDVARNSAATIRANAMPRLAGNFFSIDLVRAQRAFESVPWVRRAAVQRVWPDRLAVRLEEHRVAAWWQGDGNDRLVNLQGEVFEANPGDVEDDDLPVLRGPEGSSAAMLAMHRRLAPAFAALELRLERLTMSARGSWRAELDSGAEVELGRGSEAEVLARTEAFVGTVGQLTTRYQRPLAYADLRHADGYALKLRGIGTLAPGATTKK
ncbi:cell division protein FtsQ/DivIB [uncultured Methylibium sp.]|uniref:cell division protein FtsQ/DivIB n=1 Tax=uncultured Methylibium sp. TaxID=381093 RepID=UPI0025DF5696|nr:cell division protein FtsQ/DivIB [uncultured Methylibium sp.]